MRDPFFDHGLIIRDDLGLRILRMDLEKYLVV
jgi:hypothetical protein